MRGPFPVPRSPFSVPRFRYPGNFGRTGRPKLVAPRKGGVMSTLSSKTLYPVTPSPVRWIAIAFIAGAISVLVFHQGAVALLGSLGMTDRVPYVMQPTEPYGVPQVSSLTFWGGVWGVFFAVLLNRFYGWGLVIAALLLGAVLPTLVAWFLVAPLKGQAMAAGLVPMAMAVGVIANAAWGLGTGFGLALFGRKRPSERRRAINRRRTERRRSDLEPAAAL